MAGKLDERIAGLEEELKQLRTQQVRARRRSGTLQSAGWGWVSGPGRRLSC